MEMLARSTFAVRGITTLCVLVIGTLGTGCDEDTRSVVDRTGSTYGFAGPTFATSSGGLQQLSGHRTNAMIRAPLAGRVESEMSHTVTIGLPTRNPEGLTKLVADVSDPASLSYRHFLTPDDFAERFGATPSEYERLAEWAGSQNLKFDPHPSRLVGNLTGSTANLESALHLHLNYGLRPDGSRFYAPDREPSLDLDLSVSHIGGLDNFDIPRASSSGGSGPSGQLWGNDFRHAYASCTSLTGTGQSIGILSIGAGFKTSDITLYESLSGLQGVHPIQTIGPAGTGANDEDTLDIDMAISMAPGAQVIAFRGTVDQALSNMAAHPEVKQFSSSWFINLDSNAEAMIAELAAQGQSFFEASGDSGAWTSDNGPGGPSNIRAQPAVTLVGGTELAMTAPGLSYVSETTWPDSCGGPMGNGNGNIPIPTYQNGFATVANQASPTFRNAPDVSLPADGIEIVLSGTTVPSGGTSAATPLWAGFMALINEQAQIDGLGSIGFANPAFYLIAKSPSYGTSFNDVVTGSNPSTILADNGFAFNATPGYDLTTGLGSPACGLIATLGNPRSSKAAPGSAVFFGQLHTVYVANNSGNGLLHISSTDGVNWGPETPVNGISSPFGPALVAFGAQLHMFFINNDGSNAIMHATSEDGVNWSGSDYVAAHLSKATPGVAVFNDQIHLVYIADNSGNGLLHVSSSDGVNWGPETGVGSHSSSAGPAVTVLNNALHVTYIANNSGNGLLHVSSTDGVNWGAETGVGSHSSKAGPALTVFNNALHMTYVANNSGNGLLHVSSTNGVNWGAETGVGSQASPASPTLVGFNGSLRMSYVSNAPGLKVLMRISSPNGTTWGTATVW